MKQFILDVDITMSKRISVEAESEERAKAIVNGWMQYNPYEYAYNFDAYVKHEITDVTEDEDYEPLADYSEDYRKGIAYALEHLDKNDAAIIRAECEKAYCQHLVPDASTVDDSRITDLLEEYGEDNGLPEGWYLDEYDASEILLLV